MMKKQEWPLFKVKSKLVELLLQQKPLVPRRLLRSDGIVTDDSIDSSTVGLFLLHVTQYVHSQLHASDPSAAHRQVTQCLTAVLDLAQTKEDHAEDAVIEAIAAGTFTTGSSVVSVILRHLREALTMKEGAAPVALALLKVLSCDTQGARVLVNMSACFQLLMKALQQWRDVPATVSDILSISWELLWFDPIAAVPMLVSAADDEAITLVASVLKSYLRMPGDKAKHAVKNAVGLLLQLDYDLVFLRLRTMLFAGSVQSDEEVACLMDAVLAIVDNGCTSGDLKSLPSLVAGMKLLGDLLPFALKFLSRPSRFEHMRVVRELLDRCVISPTFNSSLLPLCDALLRDYQAADLARIAV